MPDRVRSHFATYSEVLFTEYICRKTNYTMADKEAVPVADDQSIDIHGTVVAIDEQEVEKAFHHKLDADDALAFVQAHGITVITPEEDKRILRKIDMWLMPIVGVPVSFQNATLC